MLEKFVDMNLEMHKTGSLSASISKEELLRMVAQVPGTARRRAAWLACLPSCTNCRNRLCSRLQADWRICQPWHY